MYSMNSEPKRLKTINCIAYGMGDMYGGGSFFIISTFAMYYLIAVIGMSPILAGLIPGLGKVWDSISDPLMGYITDRTKSRYGRRRVFFLIVIIPIALSFSLIWLPVSFSSDFGLFIYYFLAYLFFYTTTTMALVPYSALSAEMTRTFTERNKLTGFRMFFSMFATLLAGLLAQPLITSFGGGARGHLMMGIIFSLLFAVPWIFVFLGTWELPVREGEEERGNVFGNFASMFANRSFRIHILMYIFAYGAMDILMAWFKFYMLDYLQRGNFITIGLGSILITQILVLPLYIKLANRSGHARAYLLGLSIWALAMLGMVFQTPASPTWLLTINCIAIGAGLGAGTLIPYQILPFVADVDELMTGRKRAGIYSGAMTLLRKLIQGALVLPVLGLLLSTIGYLGPIPEAFTEGQLKQGVIQRLEENNDTAAAELVAGAYRYVADDCLYRLDTADPAQRRLIRKALNSIDYRGFGASSSSIALQQESRTVAVLRVLFFVSPLTFLLLGIITSLFFPITPKIHRVMMEEIARLNEGGSPDGADPLILRHCRSVTGYELKDLPRFRG